MQDGHRDVLVSSENSVEVLQAHQLSHSEVGVLLVVGDIHIDWVGASCRRDPGVRGGVPDGQGDRAAFDGNPSAPSVVGSVLRDGLAGSRLAVETADIVHSPEHQGGRNLVSGRNL